MLGPADKLRFQRQGNLALDEGTIEMWIATRADGNDPVYAERSHPLFYYRALNGDNISIMQSNKGVLYAGGTVRDQWQSAYSNRATTRTWHAGQWHHLVYTFSVSNNSMQFYLDGVLLAESNEGHYWMPSLTANDFYIGTDPWSNVAHYLIDEVRILGRVATREQIAAWAKRRHQPKANEVWLDTKLLEPSDSVIFEFTPSDNHQTGVSCLSDPLVYPGIPVTDPNPPSTLLKPNTRKFTLSVRSPMPTECRYALRSPLQFDKMASFDSGAGTTVHETVVTGLDINPNVVNNLYIRCAAYPDFLLHLKYRCLSPANPSFPRTGNLWGGAPLIDKGMPHCARIDLWLGVDFNEDQIYQLRQLNPDIQILTSINAIEHKGLSEDYYLHDAHGNRVEVWPGSYRLNLTKFYVAEYQAQYAYQRILDNNLMFDGCFFDNVMTTQSWQKHDIYGNPFHPDADEDGIPDDLAAFDAAWKAGVFYELTEFRKLMPHALVTGHSMNIYESGIDSLFNGISIGFWTAEVIEGRRSFTETFNMYNAWNTDALSPHITMIESSPPHQIAYGYDYAPWDKIPPSTLEFARTYYPYMRFGLAFTLMNNGYFAHEYGDTWHGNDWWYDELDFDLGYPLGPPESLNITNAATQNLIDNPSFEQYTSSTWNLWANSDAGCIASLSRDRNTAAHGSASARIDISATSGANWHIELQQRDITLIEGTEYKFTFWSKAEAPRKITVCTLKQSPDWDFYGLSKTMDIGADWRQYSTTFIANANTNESRIQFQLGAATDTIWIDDINLHPVVPTILQRRFTNGLVLLNPSEDHQTIHLGSGYRRLTGTQAPRHEYITDDADETFSASSHFTEVTYDSGEWKASGPFYHDWGPACHEARTRGATARWNLNIPQANTYTIKAWYPAGPDANRRSRSVLYEVVTSQNSVVASKTLNQTTAGDQWHLIAEAALTPKDAPFVRLTCTESKPCIADALYVTSAARYNDGSPASEVTLQPMDGIVLEWTGTPGDSLSTEGFETGDFKKLDWATHGDAAWTVTSAESNSGTYSAQAGEIDDYGRTILQVRLDCVSGNISFYLKVDSEWDFDYLKFYINGVKQDEWSGKQDWTKVSFPVTAGIRTFEWTYSKDSSTSIGSDTAWIDDIVFPIN
jgi:hypothetical protein